MSSLDYEKGGVKNVSSDKPVIAFDLYGTLLSTESIKEKVSEFFGQLDGADIAIGWRKHQLEYTWRLNSMGMYRPFDEVTRDALHNAAEEIEMEVDEDQEAEYMEAYKTLSTFPDATSALNSLIGIDFVVPVIFSNGTLDMVSTAISNSKDLSPFSSLFQKLVVVDDVKVYKPAPETYSHLAREVGKNDDQRKSIWLVSANAFDIVGGGLAGLSTIWIDRKPDLGWIDRLSPGFSPTAVVSSLEEVLDVVVNETNRAQSPTR